MIEKLNKVLEKLPPEHREIMREAFTILIEEVINAIVKEIRQGFSEQAKENQRIWQNIERIWQSIEQIRKDMNERFERQEKENQRIWQNIERIWQSIEEMRKDMKEGFERQERENQRIWQAIEKLTQAIDRLDKKIDRKITSLGARWGLMAEETFRGGIRTIIEDLGYAVENIVFFDEEGYVFLKPSQVEIDIIIKDSKKIAIEIKSSISEGDVSTFERKVKLYEKKFNTKIDKKIILTPSANDKAVVIAKSFDIEIVEELKE
ncbi:MAG: DUF3782 domain-containing protein [candidate division WOR-3 bacterium]